jgi:hypothetical protein
MSVLSLILVRWLDEPAASRHQKIHLSQWSKFWGQSQLFQRQSGFDF